MPSRRSMGAKGTHLDQLEIGRGWHKSRCDLLGDTFTVGEDERVNVCMRVIHARGEGEELTVYWERDGKLNQRSKVWKATIETADKAVIGEIEFTIQ